MLKQQQKVNKQNKKKSVRANFQFHTLSLAYYQAIQIKEGEKQARNKGRAEAK